ncbi:rolling circle replication-associated protein [uncultured Flavonifractor sp.]|uniref:rolling circle replication-associated protein n=1 Tax=uncultured Flavonifractor sp. TaxID=1193534 RepID=UPI0026264394|nr:hypothetical protein [uncultured Flavonifractor sp.]
MAKRKKTIVAGDLIKTVIYTAPEPRDGPRVRAAKSRMTSAAQKAMNDKTARGKLEMQIAAAFKRSDLFLTLTYRPKDLPANRKGAVINVRKFLRNMREYRKSVGIPFKYIYVTEEKHGDGKLHHHIIMNATERDIETIRSLWPYGDVIDIEYLGCREYVTWAEYMTKEGVEGRQVGAQLWTSSKNLEKPKVTYSYVDNDETLTAPIGAHVLEKEEKVTEFGSYCYIKYYIPPKYWGEERPQKSEPWPLMSCL